MPPWRRVNAVNNEEIDEEEVESEGEYEEEGEYTEEEEEDGQVDMIEDGTGVKASLHVCISAPRPGDICALDGESMSDFYFVQC